MKKRDRYARNIFLFFLRNKWHKRKISELCVADFQKLADYLILSDELVNGLKEPTHENRTYRHC